MLLSQEKKMNVKNVALLALGVLILSSCASHSTMRGSVAMKTGEDTAHVCLGDGEIRQGDKVIAYKNVCTNNNLERNTRSHLSVSCKKEKIGEGSVLNVINEHYSEVKFDAGVPFTEGTIVEKAK
jgi:hypothetical protein